MRRTCLALVVATVCIASVSAQVRHSASSCSDLGLDAGNGSPDVCGKSHLLNDGMDCVPASTFASAFRTCQDADMRLCTVDELEANEVSKTGCDLDLERVWSGSHEGCPTGYVLSTGGATFDGVSLHPTQCTRDTAELYVRCCADADVPDDVCEGECSVDDGNSCFGADEAFRCVCDGEGYTEGVDGLYCVAPFDVCEEDPCGDVAGNTCVPSGASYTCVCGALGYMPNADHSSCDERPDACRDSPCSNDVNRDNYCTDRRDGTYLCTCGGERWSLSPDGKGCVFAEDGCAGNPCHSAEDAKNVCTDLYDGTHTCLCGGNRWFKTPEFEGCYLRPNACRGSPCSSNIEAGNTCVADDGGYSCECATAKGWRQTGDGQGCERIPNTCLINDPCDHDVDILNKCTDNGDGTHVCACNGRGYMVGEYNGSAAISCEPIPNPCDELPCDNDVIGNICTDKRDGTYACSCGAAGYKDISDHLSCQAPENKCESSEDYCHTGRFGEGGPKNECHNNRDGTYVCVCGEGGWIKPFRAQTCTQLPSRCNVGDPCSNQVNANNLCYPDDGGYRCECDSNQGWRNSPDNQRCEAPINPCAVADPCHRSMNSNNICEPDFAQEHGYYCICDIQAGWKQSDNWDTCTPPVNQCEAKDPCSTEKDHGNRCFDNYDGTYYCTCNTFNKWTPSTTNQAQGCIEPVNPCMQTNADVCSTGGSSTSLNKCVYEGNGIYYCLCNERGFKTGANDQSCIKNANPCDDRTYDQGGPCVDVKPGNSCKPAMIAGAYTGEYECTCALPFTAPAGKKRCVPPKNPCMDKSDKCMTKVDRANVCSPLLDAGGLPNGLYSCLCLGRGWEASDDGLRCEPPKNQCVEMGDPCGHRLNPNNVCISENDGTYHCECDAPGWAQGPAGVTCLCPDPCAMGDPCALWQSKDNICKLAEEFDFPIPGMSGPDLDLMNPLVHFETGFDPEDFKCPQHQCTCGGDWKLVTSAFGHQRCVPPNPCAEGDPCKTRNEPDNHCVNMFVESHDPDPWGIIEDHQLMDFPRPPSTPVAPAYQSYVAPVQTSYPSYYATPVQQQYVAPQQQFFAPAQQSTYQAVFPASMPQYSFPTQAYPSTLSYPSTASYPTMNYPSTLSSYSLPNVMSGISSYPAPAASTVYNAAPSVTALGPSASRGATSTSTGLQRTHTQLWNSDLYKDVNSYMCECNAVGWTTPLGAQWCDEPNPCLVGDPCSSRENRDNKCWPGRKDGTSGVTTLQSLGGVVDDYYCDCRGRGWYTPVGSQRCEKCVDPCTQGDPCSNNYDGGNTCTWALAGFGDVTYDANGDPNFFDIRRSHLESDGVSAGTVGIGQCGSFTCNCAGQQWVGNAPYGDACIRCNNPCELNPCLGQASGADGDERNTCTWTFADNTPFNWLDDALHASKVTSKVPGGRRLLQNPLSEVRVPLANLCGTWTCSCKGRNWMAPQGKKTCVKCGDPCAGDPCSSELDSMNKCIPTPISQVDEGTCAGFVCNCDGESFLTTITKQRCERCVDPCLQSNQDPCYTAKNPMNVCRSFDKSGQLKPVYSVPIDSPTRTTTAPRGRRLLQLGTQYYPSSSLNSYIPQYTAANTYTTTQLASNVFSQYPTAQYPASTLYNPATTLYQPQVYQQQPIFVPRAPVTTAAPMIPTSNVVVRPANGPETPFTPILQTAILDTTGMRVCGEFVCECRGEGWVGSSTQNNKSCNRVCENRCQSSDPCLTIQNSKNKCAYIEDADPLECGYHRCTCDTGFVKTFGSQGCVPKPPNPCTAGGDPCLRSLNAANQCVLLNEATAQYQCSCNNAAGFYMAANGRACREGQATAENTSGADGGV